jgi:hypothetical protein
VRPVYLLLPNNPARQKTTSNKQSTSTKRYKRSATRVRERAASRSRSRAATTGGAATTAATGGRGALLGMHGALLGLSSAVVAAVDDDGAVLKRRSRAEAREHLLLIDAQALGSPGNRTGAFTLLVLGVHGSLDLVARVLQDRNIPTSRCLREGGGCGCQHHGQHRCQQHYLLQINASSLTLLYVLWKFDTHFCTLYI